MSRVAFVVVVLLARAVASAAQLPLPDPDANVLIQLGIIYSHAKDDAEFARNVRVLADECVNEKNEKDAFRRMQFPYDALEVSKLMEPKSCYVTLKVFAESLPHNPPADNANEFRAVLLFELWRLAFEEYRANFGLDQTAVESFLAASLASQASSRVSRLENRRAASNSM